jgi:hypothetical protein
VTVIAMLLWTWGFCGQLFYDHELLHWMGFWSCANTGSTVIFVAGASAISHYDLLANFMIEIIYFMIQFGFAIVFLTITGTIREMLRILRWILCFAVFFEVNFILFVCT